jgi:hypothetical protein
MEEGSQCKAQCDTPSETLCNFDFDHPAVQWWHHIILL